MTHFVRGLFFVFSGKTPNDDAHNTKLNLSEKLAIGVCEKVILINIILIFFSIFFFLSGVIY